jgi:hypothetical protein
LIEEFTLILCVTPPDLAGDVPGGETVIYSYPKGEVPFDTTTPGSGLLFRKDLEHAGNMLELGEKHIITANLWATRKELSKQVLLVTFPTINNKKEENPGVSSRTRAKTATVLEV